MNRLLPGWPLAAAAVLAAGCHAAAPVAPRNVVLVTIDTLRADRLGRGIAPTLDALAGSGLRFSHARTTAPLTLPAHTSILTGLAPPAHGVHDNGVVFGGAEPTLATAFVGAGYRTAAFVGAYVLDRRFGLARGFDVYDDRIDRDPSADARLEAERPAAAVVDAALAWLDTGGDGPFFLWVHLYDPHAPYAPPPGAVPAGATGYDAEVAYADAQIARLLARLDASGRRDTTIVAVTGDHGEGLGDHGERTHGMLAYDATLRVPLVLAIPGEPARVIDTPVSLADLAPTLLRLAGAAATLSPAAMGHDLLTTAAADVYAETEYPKVAGWHPLQVLVDGRWKLLQAATPALFDVVADPGETTDLAPRQRQVVAAMVARLRAVQEGAASRADGPAGADARLRALGYVSGPVAATPAAATAADPAAAIAEWSAFEAALGRLTGGDAAGALPALRALSERFPAGAVFQSTYARALQDHGQPAAAVAVLRAALARRPDATHFHDLAVAARLAGDDAEAQRAEEAALALDPAFPAALNGLGLGHADAGRSAEAAAAFARAADLDPSNASTWANLGNARRALGDLPGAEAAYRRGLESQPGHVDATNGLGVVLVQSGRAADAVPWLERAVAAAPDFHEARLNLGIALQQSGDAARAAATYRALLARAPARFVRERQAATELLRGLR